MIDDLITYNKDPLSEMNKLKTRFLSHKSGVAKYHCLSVEMHEQLQYIAIDNIAILPVLQYHDNIMPKHSIGMIMCFGVRGDSHH